MARFLNRFLSLVVCGLYVLAAYSRDGSMEAAFKAGIALILPLACIWYGSALGQYTGFMRGHYVSEKTPGILVAGAGWFFLIGAPWVGYLLSKGLY